ncbi:transcriptional adapter 2-alpha-like [Halichondria panicea]|uniref:transcriptional adapter 2-alpha-like n=1 Tax=Halichondria panicea TaxID=6063 RepID=UPI00312B406B
MESGLFCDDWTGKEELQLLEAIDEYGYGNWAPISTQVGKTLEECQDHYNNCYMFNPHPVLPAIPLRPEVCRVVKSDSHARGESESNDPVPVYYPGTEISGFMPRRGDFAVEPDNGAESIVANLSPDSDDDDMLMKAFNLASIKIYCSRLKQRAARKSLVREYGLLDIKKQIAIDKTRLTKSQLRLKMVARPFMRFMSPQSAAKFLISHYMEDELHQQIKKLKCYRENGITTLKGADLYEKLLTRRRQQECEQRECVRGVRSEETFLYQVLQHGSMKIKKPAVKESKPLDITFSAGVELLEEDEKELCSSTRIQPMPYLQYKKTVLAEYEKHSRLTLAECRKLLKIDVNKTRKIFNLFVSRGWIVHIS